MMHTDQVTSPPQETPKPQISTRLALILIMTLGGALRLPGLDRDLWFDEAASLFNARGADALMTKIIPNGPEFTSDMFARDGGWRGTLSAVGHSEMNPPLYFLLLRLWMKLFGETNRSLRLLSVVFGLTAMLAIFVLARRLFNENVGLAAAGVLVFLPLHIQFSQEIRAYALAILLVTLASWAFWMAYQLLGQRAERRYWLLYGVLASASLYTHYLAAGVFIAHGVFALIQPRELRLALIKRLAGADS